MFIQVLMTSFIQDNNLPIQLFQNTYHKVYFYSLLSVYVIIYECDILYFVQYTLCYKARLTFFFSLAFLFKSCGYVYFVLNLYDRYLLLLWESVVFVLKNKKKLAMNSVENYIYILKKIIYIYYTYTQV